MQNNLSKTQIMKHIIYFLVIGLMSYSANSQLNYVDIDWVIDQSQVMADGEIDSLEIDIDQNGSIDMRISSWSKHQSGIETVVEVIMLNDYAFGGLENTSCEYIADCPSNGFTYKDIAGYIYTSNCGSNPYANQYVKFPFQFQGVNGVHCGFLYVRYVGTTITIEGYAWNPVAGGNCSCSTSGWLSLKQLDNPDIDLGEYQYYNLLGQRVNDPKGLTLKVYESGLTEKVYLLD